MIYIFLNLKITKTMEIIVLGIEKYLILILQIENQSLKRIAMVF
jgi:hypothetical protein